MFSITLKTLWRFKRSATLWHSLSQWLPVSTTPDQLKWILFLLIYFVWNSLSGNDKKKNTPIKYSWCIMNWVCEPVRCCVWACWLLFERSLILMTFLRGFVMGPTDAWRALHHTQQKHGDTQSGTCLLIDASPLSICIACLCVCFCVCVWVWVCLRCIPLTLFLSHTSFPKHLTQNVKETLIDTSSGLNNVFCSS